MLTVQTFVFNPFLENTYVVFSENRCAIVIDPGCQTRKEQALLETFLRDLKLDVRFVLNTHLHVDHIYGNEMLSEKFGALIYASAADCIARPEPVTRRRQYWPFSDTEPTITQYITAKNQSVITEQIATFLFSDLTTTYHLENEYSRLFQILKTPGHSEGGLSFYFPTANSIFVGDVLENGNWGSLQYIYSDFEKMKCSVQKLFALPPETIIYFGHGESCTIEKEQIALAKMQN